MTDPAIPAPRAWHPPFLAAWPVLVLWAGNASEARWQDATRWTAIVVGCTVALYFLTRLLVRNRLKAAFLTSLLALWFLCYGSVVVGLAHIVDALGLDLSGSHSALRHRYALPATAVLAGLVAIPILRSRRDLHGATRITNFIAVLLVCVSLFQIGFQSFKTASADRVIDDAVAVETEQIGPGALPDIYFLVLDRYPSNAVLKTAYGYDNSSFLEQLKKQGFHVVEDGRCNYASSLLSLSSTLNMEYMPGTLEFGPLVRDFQAGHRVGTFLKEREYQYVHLGSWYEPTARCDQADRMPQQARRSEFGIALLRTTPLVAALKGDPLYAIHGPLALFQFDMLERLATEPGPKFVFAHVLLPHPPIVFDESGNFIWERISTKAGFINQLRFTNDRVNRLIAKLLAQPRPPVIILQADEGPLCRSDDFEADRTTRMKIRTGILNACYLPGAARTSLPRWFTPVNTFRFVFREYFGAKFDALEDKVFGWTGMNTEGRNKSYIEFEDITNLVR